MGFMVFVCIISFLIVSQIRSIITLNTTDDVSEDIGDEYFDDFETL